jgi:hypothetical protein
MTNEDEAAETQRRGEEMLGDGETEKLLAQYFEAYNLAMAARRYDVAATAIEGMDNLLTKHDAVASTTSVPSEARQNYEEAKRRYADVQVDDD